jgi:hypothetical protein
MARDRERKSSDPKMLAAKLEKAKAEGTPIDLVYEDVTGVLDVTLQRAQACADEGVAQVRKLVKKMDSIPGPLKTTP